MPTNLNRIRCEQGYSAHRLAEVLGVKERTVMFWQAGDHFPCWKYGRRLERLFGTPLEILLAPERESAPADDDEGAKSEALSTTNRYE